MQVLQDTQRMGRVPQSPIAPDYAVHSTWRRGNAAVGWQQHDLKQQSDTSVITQPGEVIEVKSVEELKAALEDGVANIAIQEHLDLTRFDVQESAGLLGVIPTTLQSIRVRCPS